MKTRILTLAALLAGCAGAHAAASVSSIAYMSLDGQEPWGQSSNVDAMNAAFGAGRWDRIGFNDGWNGYAFVYVDGSESAGVAFQSFVDANRGDLESYVTGGGRLFLNVASNTSAGQTYSLVFGATTMEGQYSEFGHATLPGSNPLVGNGSGTDWSGSWFAHNVVTPGGGFTTFITGDDGQAIVAGISVGQGTVLLGGQTTTGWHSGVNGSDPFQLRVNELTFAATGSITPAVPEPETYALMLAGLGAIAMLARRRRPAD